MQQPEKMHPDDKRNLILFIAVAIGVWLIFDAYLLKPKLEELQQVQEQQQADALVPKLSAEQVALARVENKQSILAQSQRIKIENGSVFGSFSTEGGVIDDLQLTDYYETLKQEKNVALLEPNGSLYPRYVNTGWLSSDTGIDMPDDQTIWGLKNENAKLTPETPVTLIWQNDQGLTFEREISIDESYVMTVKQSVLNTTGQTITVFPYALLAQHGLPRDQFGRWIVHEGPIAYMEDELVELSYKKIKRRGSEEKQANDGWIGITERYWFTGLIPQSDDETHKYRFIYKEGTTSGDAIYQVDKTGSGEKLLPGAYAESVTHIFVGPKELLTVQDYSERLSIRHFDLVIDFGMWYFIAKPFFYLLHFLYTLMGNYGFAIVVFTILVRLAAFPLNNLSYRSFAKLRKIGPQMKELREKHGDDKEGLQKELVKLYEKEKVNPLSGCLPILIQIPIFFALYKVLLISIEMRHEPFIGWIHDLSAPDPTSFLNLFGLFDYGVPAFFQIGAWPCLMLFFMLLQRRLHPPATDPIQKGIMDAMPFVVFLILSKFASGLVIYWTFSNAFSVLQQYVIMRSMGIKVSFIHGRQEDEELEEAVKDGPVVHPEMGVIKDEVEKALFDEPLEIEKDPDYKSGDDKESDDKGPEITPPKPKKKKKKK